MNSRLTVQSWLDELKPHLPESTDLNLDDNGNCRLQYRGRFEMMVSCPENSPNFFFVSFLAEGPKPHEEAAFCQELLKLNYCTLETQGATLALHEKTNDIVLSYGHPLEHTESGDFRNLLGNFLETSNTWFDRLGDMRDGFLSNGDSEPAQPPGDIMGPGMRTNIFA